ncbi:MAG: hypothetical protein EXQ93_06720 [Alphaproteobacteria bacterium]|nr:hypothetical protein [Alphaproteobacteria bacterium]
MRLLIPAVLTLLCVAAAWWGFSHGHMFVLWVAGIGTVIVGSGLVSEVFNSDPPESYTPGA